MLNEVILAMLHRCMHVLLHDLAFDSVTVAPYMGKDSVEPFLAFENKHTILLALTSNEGAFDFQTQMVNGNELYKQVIETSKTWQNSHHLMYVVGATKSVLFFQKLGQLYQIVFFISTWCGHKEVI